jgi:hypothetical protein
LIVHSIGLKVRAGVVAPPVAGAGEAAGAGELAGAAEAAGAGELTGTGEAAGAGLETPCDWLESNGDQ